MWLEYLLLRDGSVELLTSPTLMKKEASKDAFLHKRKKDCSKRDGRGGKYRRDGQSDLIYSYSPVAQLVRALH